MKQKILDLLNEKQSKTNGGMTLVEITQSTKITYQESKIILKELFLEKKITTKKGINGILIYKK
jgi:hypothetical protein